MNREQFEAHLEQITYLLREAVKKEVFRSAKEFEDRVRQVAHEVVPPSDKEYPKYPHPQAFPDIDLGEFGIEVKFTLNDDWRSVANSVLETNRIESVKYIYVVFGKMGGVPDVRWGRYEDCVMHVRTSHVPRFEVQIGAPKSLFEVIGVSYDEFRVLEMHEKMRHIRNYARSRLRKGERLWWLEDEPGEQHTLPIQARLFTWLEQDEKRRLRAEAILLCPEILKSGRSRNKYDNVALFMLTYHGILCHQARDMFSAGSVGNPENDDAGGLYIARMLKYMEEELQQAASRMDDALFEEYWGEAVPPKNRIKRWLEKADKFAEGQWIPSKELFDGRYSQPN